MKVSINSPVFEQPFGGGMNFVLLLKDFLENNGVQVINHLEDNDIDIILHVNVTYTFSYTFYKAYLYKIKYPNTMIIQRVNDSGYHRDNSLMSDLMVTCGYYSDFLVYISSWLQDQMLNKLEELRPSSIIYNGGSADILKTSYKEQWNKQSKLKIVTHHWSSNYQKGRDIYQLLDDVLDSEEFASKYEFTYIGNYPSNLEYKNTVLLPVMSKKELYNELTNHHVYLTGSKNEAAGMHVIEGALAGLPVLYLESGGIPEYVHGYGVGFKKNNFIKKLNEMYETYDDYFLLMKNYNMTADKMSQQYLQLFKKIVQKKDLDPIIKFSIRKNKYFLMLKDILYKYTLAYGSYFK